MLHGPAYRLETERLVVRALEPRDAEALREVLASNQHHLSPWVDWARDVPRTLDGVLDVVRRIRGRFDLGEAFAYGVARRSDGALVGGVSLSPVPTDVSATIGYWLAADATGQGFAAESVEALLVAAFEVERLDLIEIHGAAANEKSLSVARRTGFHLDGTWRARLRHEDGTRHDRTTYSLLRAEFEATRASRPAVTAYDALGRVLVAPSSATSRRSPFR